MKKVLSYMGTMAFVLQIASVCMYGILLHNERHDPNWRPGVLLNAWQSQMLGASIKMLGLSGIVAIIGIGFPGSRVLAAVTICLIVPIILVLGAFQGAS